MLKKKKSDFLFSAFPLCFVLLYFTVSVLIICQVDVAATAAACDDDQEEAWDSEVGPFVPRDQRRSLVSTEYGEISAANVSDGINGSYYLQFIKLEPNALFLPVILHADMVFYVQTGSGRVGFINEDGGEENGKKKGDKARTQRVDIKRGDVYRLPPETVFFIQSSVEPERQKLRICAIFANSEQDLREPVIGPYSSIRDLVLGFDKKILQAAFQVPEEVAEEITSSKKPAAIVHGVPKSSGRTLWEVEAQFVEVLFGRKNYNMFDVNKKKGKSSGYNILTGNRDVQNCNGWSSTVTSKQLRSLGGSSIGIFMVNLTKGAMMGPHWNPMATEIAIVLEGRGMVHVVCPSTASETECKKKRIRVEEGDVFVVPRFHPMAQMSFNNGSFVFVGFTTTNRNNHPQFLAGKSSVLQTMDKQVLAESFNVSNSTIGRLLAPQHESIILECVSCAEEEERLLEKQIEKEKEEARKKEEEEARKREEEKRKQEEEEARKREEEKKKKEEEARKREEEEKKRKEQEEARKREEEEKRRKKEEEARKREEEEKKRKEEEARKREEEEKKRKEQEEARKREEEEKRRKEEEARRREEEKKRKEQEAAARKREEEEEARRKEEARKEEEAARRKEEEEVQAEEARREAEKAKKREEEKAKKREEEAREEEARRKEEQAQQEEDKRRQAAAKEEAARRKEQEEEKQRKERQQQEDERRRKAATREEESARQQEEEMEKQQQEEGGGQDRRRKDKEREKQQQEGGQGGGEEKESEKQQQEGRGQQEEGGGGGTQGQEGTEAEQKEARRKEEEKSRQAEVKEESRKKKEEEARQSKEEALQEKRGRNEAAREEATRQPEEEERVGGQQKQQKEKEREKQQQEGGAGSLGHEEAEQQEAQSWPGGLEKGE